MRHAWTLHGKIHQQWFADTPIPPAFVEPDPEFFSRMAAYLEKLQDTLARAKIDEPNLNRVADALDGFATLLAGVTSGDALEERWQALGDRGRKRLLPGLRVLHHQEEDVEDWDKAFFLRLVETLRGEVNTIRTTGRCTHPAVRKYMKNELTKLLPDWQEFERLCHQLEAIGHKQLRGVALNSRENSFLEGVGTTLANFMGYQGNSYLTPFDDAPRITPVFTNPKAEAAHLHVGIARPRVMYVLYPWQGRKRLCRGAILPYHEFAHGERLGDASWRQLLDKAPPALPAWLSALVVGQPPQKEKKAGPAQP